MKKINILLLVLGAVLFVSCDDFLDVKPTNRADASTAVQTTDDAQIFINGIMRQMTSYSYYGNNFIMYGDARGGDFAIHSQGRGLDGLYVFNHSASSGTWSGFWSQIYYCILQINTVIQNINVMQENGLAGSDLESFLGQAYTLRAQMYFDLVRLYGKPYNMDSSSYGVPLILVPSDASDQPLRNSVAEVYAQVLKDLADGAALLPTSRNDGYVSYYSNKALQAKVMLYMENYSGALAAAEEVINSGKYSLYSNGNWVDSWTEQFGSESIFELGIYPNEADQGSSSLGFMLRRQSHGSTKAMGWFMGSTYFLNRLGQDPNDVRWGVMAYDESGTDHLGSCYKYSGSTSLAGDGKSTATAVNIKVMRLSEVYLIAAEAALGTNAKGKAVTYLNAIRKRSPGLAPATEATISVDMILDERSKELFAEGNRFFDMMRLNKSITFEDEFITPAVVITHREKTIDRTFYKTILPIAKTEIDANPPIGAQQNPGY